MIINCLEWKPLPIYGSGENVRDWLYVSDHCSAIKKVFDKGKIGEEAKVAWEQNPEDRPDWDEVKKELTGYEIKAYRKGDFCKKYPKHKICSG